MLVFSIMIAHSLLIYGIGTFECYAHCAKCICTDCEETRQMVTTIIEK